VTAQAATKRIREPEVDSIDYRTILDNLPTAAILLNDQLKVTFANQAACMLGLPTKDLVGLSILSILPSRKFGKFLQNLQEPMTKVLELEMQAQDQRPGVTLKITMLAVSQQGGSDKRSSDLRDKRMRGMKLLLCEDVTERALLEQQLIHAEKLAGMGQLAAGVAHELANPLTSMASNLIFIRERLSESSKDQVGEAVDTTIECLSHMQELLSTLSSFTRHRLPRYESADLHDLLRRSIAFISKDASSRQVEVDLSILPIAFVCEFDVRMIKQVLLNLFKNAMEAMPTGGQLKVRTKWRPENKNCVEAAVIEISDTGIGIGEADLPKVFRPLYSTKLHGMGLGLPFCRQVVEQHGGEIHVASRSGKGTTVTVILPIYQGQPGKEKYQPRHESGDPGPNN